jgi:mannose-1-phosphate guanylyltransferase/mannose-6-phosphate isomerase
LVHGPQFQVKELNVNAGASLSLQYHHHRAEHWIVVDGTAEVTRGDDIFDLKQNESTFIAPKQAHRLTNRGPGGLKLIEVQCGDYLGEDDIVRLEDNYGRQ